MIKLIATDIDGTLLKDGTLMLDPEYMTVIEKLIAKGIRFVACSGRQFISERKLFAPIRDKLLYITDGGTVVRTPKEILKVHILETAMLDTRDTCNYVAERLGAEPVQAIGNKFIIYRKSDEEKYRKIELPRK
jgi:HAD superfamily hydrolase (TIGR01484 family)